MRFPRLLTLLALAVAGGLHASTPQDLAAEAIAKKLEVRRSSMGLDEHHGFRFAGSFRDGEGMAHHRFQQTYRGVRVWGGDVIVHVDQEGREGPFTDALQRGIPADTTPMVAQAEALSIADRALAPKGPYAHAPSAELVLVPRHLTLVNPSPKGGDLNAMDVAKVMAGRDLAWHVHAVLENGKEETAHTDFFIDAHSGMVLKRWSTLQTTGATGTGRSQYSGTVTLNTNSTATGYELVDTTRGTGGANSITGKAANATYDFGHVYDPVPAVLYTDADNTWGDGQNYVLPNPTGSANGQTAAVDAHYGMQITWDMYKNVFGRDGIDNHGTATFSRVHYYVEYDNAFWSDDCFCMTYGDGSGAPFGFSVLTSLDVAGHEMSHGVCASSANLYYYGESGGLNESNSDIFGTLAEFYAKGPSQGTGAALPDTGGNWLIGDQLSATPLRYMYKPSLDHASADEWSANLDGLDVHYSSGPNNRAFYFLSQGATVSGDTSTPRLPAGMAGIGNQKAAKLWYRALTAYLTSTSDYRAARAAMIRAAVDLFPTAGSTPSAEYQAVQNAYAGINVGYHADGSFEDYTPPVLSNLHVTGSTGVIALSANATDNKVMGRVDFFIDGALIGSAAGAGPAYALNVDSTAYAYGAHQLAAVAVDANGNVSPLSAPVSFYLLNPVSEAIGNGGFEEGWYQSWTTTYFADLITDPAYVHRGSVASWLGGWYMPNGDAILQTVTLPDQATQLTLGFWLSVYTDKNPANGAKDTFQARIMDATGTGQLAALAAYSNLDAATHGTWVQHTYDLTPFKGQTIQVRFDYFEDGLNGTSTNFLIDDVSLTETMPAVAVSAIASAMVRKAQSQTFTATVSHAPDLTVVWSVREGAAGGSITSGGVYTAPGTPGTYHVIATSVADPSKSATIAVAVINGPDINGSGKVDGLDMGLLAFKHGQAGTGLAEDLNGDGAVDDADLALLLSEFGN